MLIRAHFLKDYPQSMFLSQHLKQNREIIIAVSLQHTQTPAIRQSVRNSSYEIDDPLWMSH